MWPDIRMRDLEEQHRQSRDDLVTMEFNYNEDFYGKPGYNRKKMVCS